ncbi:hypothetical protein CR513_19613, partial [Mucuna pruriens]
MSQFLEKGLSIEMKQNKCKFFQGENLNFEIFMTTNRMFFNVTGSSLALSLWSLELHPQLNFANIISKGSIKEILFHNKLIHFDICSPINPTSNGNKITFIDDLSRKVWVYFLVRKLKNKLVSQSKFCALTEGENTPPRSLLNFVMSMVFKDNSLHHICHNKMA